VKLCANDSPDSTRNWKSSVVTSVHGAGRVPGCYEIDEVKRRYGIEPRAEGMR
jgi:hypothetical protein